MGRLDFLKTGSVLLWLSAGAAAYQAEVEPVPARGYFDAAVREVDGAKVSIDLFMYSFMIRPGQARSLPFRLAEALRAARGRGVKVRVVLDQGPDAADPEAGPDARNGAARDYLAGAGIPVFMDDPAVTTHAKALIVDGKTALLGSTNWTTAALTRNVEADVLVRSPEYAQELLKELDAGVAVDAPAAPPVSVPAAFVLDPRLMGAMAGRSDERAFDVYLFLLKERPGDAPAALDTEALAGALGIGSMTREAYRRQIAKTLAKLRDDYGLIRFTGGYGEEPQVALLPIVSTGSVGVPRDFWAWGWNRRLSFPGKFFYLLGLHYSAASQTPPRWRMSGAELSRRHGVSAWFITQGVTELRRAGLLEVEYGELTRDGAPHAPNAYTPRRLYDPEALEARFRGLVDEYGAEKVGRARALAALVYADSDAPGVERLIRMEDQYGLARIQAAEKILAAKSPDNPLRTMAYLLGTIEKLP